MYCLFFFCFKQKTAYEMRISDWSSDVCSSDLVNVAIQVAEQISDYLLDGGITNALNVPSLSAEEAPKLKPYMALAEELGSLVGQLEGDRIQSVSVEVEGHAAELNQKPITADRKSTRLNSSH